MPHYGHESAALPRLSCMTDQANVGVPGDATDRCLCVAAQPLIRAFQEAQVRSVVKSTERVELPASPSALVCCTTREVATMTLREMYATHTGKISDKWTLYLDVYERIFAAYLDQPIALLEIGVQNGGSLEIWAEYFSSANNLVGCDINDACAELIFEDSRIEIVVGDINSDAAFTKVLGIAQEYDIVIDDGSHTSADVIKSFSHCFKALKDGGVYIVEDLHCSYWEEWQGGLFYPHSSYSFFKLLIDVLNHEHWGVARSRESILRCFYDQYGVEFDEQTLSQIHSIEILNSLCIIRKNDVMQNILGTRLVVGKVESVASLISSSRGADSIAPSQADNEWSHLPTPPQKSYTELLASHEQLKSESRDMRERLIGAQEDNRILHTTNASMLQSASWRATSPLRRLSRVLRSSADSTRRRDV